MSHLKFALIFGATIEAITCILMQLFGGIGPSGPINLLSQIVWIIHTPAIWIVQHIPPIAAHTTSALVTTILLTALLWSAGAYGWSHFLRPRGARLQ